MRQLVILAVMLALAGTASAKLYKWVDKDGNVTYSQQKPPDAKAEEVKLKGVPSVSNEEARERLDAISGKAETVKKDREFKENYTSETAERDDRLKENCETARENLRVLETAARVKDAEGNFLDDKSREARLNQAKQDIQNNCS